MKRLLTPLLAVILLALLHLPACATLTTATGFASGLVGTLGYKVLVPSGGTFTVATARTTAGISVGVQPGSYIANPTLPANCAVLFDDAAGHYAVQEFGSVKCVAGFASSLSTVGYTPLSSSGTAGTRTGSGVVELASGTGIYAVASITGAGATWDDGQSSPTYATEMFSSGGPLTLTITVTGNTRLLAWIADPAATSYNVARRVRGTDAYVLLANVPAGTLTYTDATAVPTVPYGYSINAVY